MERLYTERQWRAVAAIERSQGYMYPIVHEWRILGPAFAGGDFYLAARREHLLRKQWGPPKPLFWVYEKPSGLILGWESPTKGGTLAKARELLSAIPPDLLHDLMSKHREAVAAKEAREAIAQAQYRKQRKPAAAKPIGRRRKAIFEAAGGKCHYCGTALLLVGNWHVDHKMPKALGGSNDPVNLVAACARCNRAKKDKTDVEFKALLARKKLPAPAQPEPTKVG